MASQTSRPLDIALESLDGLIKEIKSRTVTEEQRKRFALKLRDVVAVCQRGTRTLLSRLARCSYADLPC